MVVIFGVFTVMAATYSPGARLAPLAVGGIGLALSLMQLVVSVRAPRGEKEGDKADHRAALVLLAWFAGFVASTILLGIVATALLLVFSFLRFGMRESFRTSVVVALPFAAVIYATFELALGVPLFEGVLKGMF